MEPSLEQFPCLLGHKRNSNRIERWAVGHCCACSLVCHMGCSKALRLLSPQVFLSIFCQPASICFSVSQDLGQSSAARTLEVDGRRTLYKQHHVCRKICAEAGVARLGAQKAADIEQLLQRLSGAASKRTEGAGMDISTQSRQETFPMSTSTCAMHPHGPHIPLLHASTCSTCPPAPHIHMDHVSTYAMHPPAPSIHLCHVFTWIMHVSTCLPVKASHGTNSMASNPFFNYSLCL